MRSYRGPLKARLSTHFHERRCAYATDLLKRRIGECLRSFDSSFPQATDLEASHPSDEAEIISTFQDCHPVAGPSSEIREAGHFGSFRGIGSLLKLKKS
jgi:hypothetical protein